MDIDSAVRRKFDGVCLGQATLVGGKVKTLIYRKRTVHPNCHFILTNTQINEDGTASFYSSDYDLDWEFLLKNVKEVNDV